MEVLEKVGGGGKGEDDSEDQNERETVDDGRMEPQGIQEMLKRRKQEKGKL